jgi:hypothetical protein
VSWRNSKSIHRNQTRQGNNIDTQNISWNPSSPSPSRKVAILFRGGVIGSYVKINDPLASLYTTCSVCGDSCSLFLQVAIAPLEPQSLQVQVHAKRLITVKSGVVLGTCCAFSVEQGVYQCVTIERRLPTSYIVLIISIFS